MNEYNSKIIQHIIAFDTQDFIDNGTFITSEPSISKNWIELDILSKKIVEENLKEEFLVDLNKIINRLIEDIFGKKNENVKVLNLCNENTSISDKDFKILFDFKYNNEVLNAFVTEDEINFSHPNIRNKNLILLTAIDSNVKHIKKLINKLRDEKNSKVVGILTIISITNLYEHLWEIEDIPWIYSVFKVKNGRLKESLPWFQWKQNEIESI